MSLLEVSTIGYAFCAIVTYGLWWKKPCITTEPTLIELASYHSLFSRICDVPGSTAPETNPARIVSSESIDQELATGPSVCSINAKVTVGNDKGNALYPLEVPAEWHQKLEVVCRSVISILYSLTHLLAWNARFPTHIESTLWHISSLITMVLGPITINTIKLLTNDNVVSVRDAGVWVGPEARVYIIIILLYSSARFFMIIETFRQVLYLPPDAFQVASWSIYLPHFS